MMINIREEHVQFQISFHCPESGKSIWPHSNALQGNRVDSTSSALCANYSSLRDLILLRSLLRNCPEYQWLCFSAGPSQPSRGRLAELQAANLRDAEAGWPTLADGFSWAIVAIKVRHSNSPDNVNTQDTCKVPKWQPAQNWDAIMDWAT